MPDNVEVGTVESRVQSLEHHMNGLLEEKLPERIKSLETGHQRLEESDKNQRLLIEAIAEQMKTHTEKQAETNFKVDGLSQSVQVLNGIVTESSAVQKIFLTEIKENTKFLQSRWERESESATTLETEKQNTKRHVSTEVFKFLGAVIGGGAGVALIQYFTNQ